MGTEKGSFVSGEGKHKKSYTSPDRFYRYKGSASVNVLNQNLSELINMNPHRNFETGKSREDTGEDVVLEIVDSD